MFQPIAVRLVAKRSAGDPMTPSGAVQASKNLERRTAAHKGDGDIKTASKTIKPMIEKQIQFLLTCIYAQEHYSRRWEISVIRPVVRTGCSIATMSFLTTVAIRLITILAQMVVSCLNLPPILAGILEKGEQSQ